MLAGRYCKLFNWFWLYLKWFFIRTPIFDLVPFRSDSRAFLRFRLRYVAHFIRVAPGVVGNARINLLLRNCKLIKLEVFLLKDRGQILYLFFLVDGMLKHDLQIFWLRLILLLIIWHILYLTLLCLDCFTLCQLCLWSFTAFFLKPSLSLILRWDQF